jgi:hypothetical protein
VATAKKKTFDEVRAAIIEAIPPMTKGTKGHYSNFTPEPEMFDQVRSACMDNDAQFWFDLEPDGSEHFTNKLVLFAAGETRVIGAVPLKVGPDIQRNFGVNCTYSNRYMLKQAFQIRLVTPDPDSAEYNDRIGKKATKKKKVMSPDDAAVAGAVPSSLAPTKLLAKRVETIATAMISGKPLPKAEQAKIATIIRGKVKDADSVMAFVSGSPNWVPGITEEAKPMLSKAVSSKFLDEVRGWLEVDE